MRVIAGTARRIRLDVAPGSATRPFLEMARGALFNSLTRYLDGARALDLFAGSGALGIEALSRGAASCAFVEADPRAADVLRGNLARCGLEERAAILRDRAESAVGRLEGPFDLVFLDPPFSETESFAGSPAGAELISATETLLSREGRIVFRLEEPAEPPGTWGALPKLADRRYGRSRVAIYGPEAVSARTDPAGGHE